MTSRYVARQRQRPQLSGSRPSSASSGAWETRSSDATLPPGRSPTPSPSTPPRDPGTWPVADARPVPDYIQDALALGQTLSTLGKAAFNGIRAYAERNDIKIDGLPADPDAEVPPDQALHIIHNFLAIQFPLLHPAAPSPAAAGT